MMTAAKKDPSTSAPHRSQAAQHCNVASNPECLWRRFIEANNDDHGSDRLPQACEHCQRSLADVEADLLDVGRQLRMSAQNRAGFQDADLLRRIEFEALQWCPRNTATSKGFVDIGRLGVYHIHELLGRGGMGEVHRATHSRLKKVVAIKVLPSRIHDNPRVVARFTREMEAVGKLEHPNVIRAFDAGEDQGRSFLVMEFLDGRDLGKILADGGRLGIKDACELARQTAIGLQYVHDRGLVHRDIKPSNLMLTQDAEGQVILKILDLGLAMLTDGRNGDENPLTDAGQLMGTLEFMSPEQTLDTRDVDYRSDIYSLGVTLFRMLTGTVPCARQMDDTPVRRLHSLMTETAPEIETRRPDLPPALATLINRMLHRKPAERPKSMSEVACSLECFAATKGLPALLDQATEDAADTTGNTVDRAWQSSDAEQIADISNASIDTARLGEQGTVTVENSRSVEPAVPNSPVSHWLFGRIRRKGWIAIATMGFAALAGALWLQTNGGYIRIDCEPEIPLVLLVKANQSFVDKLVVEQGESKVWLRAGEYEMELPREQRDRFVLSGNRFTMRRNGTAVVSIARVDSNQLTPEEKQPSAVKPDAEMPDDIRFRRMVAVWVCKHFGEVQLTNGVATRKSSEIPTDAFGIHGIRMFDCSDEDVEQLTAWLTDLPEVYHLFVNGGLGNRLSDRSLAGIGAFPNFSRIDVGSRRMTDAALESWLINPNLQELRLSELSQLGNMLDAVDSKFPNLTLLGIGTDTPERTEFEAIARMDSLRCLDLTSNQLLASVVEPITRAPIEELLLRGARQVEPEAIAMLSGMPGLRIFRMQSVSFNDAMLEKIVVTDSLEVLDISDTDVTTLQLEIFSRRYPKLLILQKDRTLPTLQIENGRSSLAPPDLQ